MRRIKGILLMGGEGTRFGGTLPKQFVRLSGKKIYLHTVDLFLTFPEFEEILLVCHKDWMKDVKEECPSTRVRVIQGGKTRQESSYLGLISCGLETDGVVIHDAVRPFVSKRIIRDNLDALETYDAVNTCIPSQDTLVYVGPPPEETTSLRSNNAQKIVSIPNRSAYLRGQTPQSFSYPLILKAHQLARVNNVSDDCRLVLDLGAPVHIILGSEDNLKITTELDLFLAEQLMRVTTPHLAVESGRSLQGKIFAITGGSGGIGSSLALFLEKEGAIPLVLARSSSTYPLDLTSYESVTETFKKIYERHGLLDGLINAAGFLKIAPFHNLSRKEIDELVAVNLQSFLYSCHAVQLKEGGHIVNLASSSFTRGRKNYALYSSAKAAIVNFTQALAEEQPTLNINALIPQRTNTPMRRKNFPEEPPETLLSSDEVAKEIIKVLQQESLTGNLIEIRKK